MNLWRSIRDGFLALFRKAKLDQEMDQEMRSHVEMRTQANIAAGMSPDEARSAAMRGFGGMEQFKERCRDLRGVGWIETFWQDVRFGTRLMCKNPGYTALAVLTMAVGIGAVTTIFSVVNGVLLRPMRFKDVDRLVMISGVEKDTPQELGYVSLLKFLEWQKESRTLAQMAFFGSGWKLVSSGGPEAKELVGAQISPDFFSVLGTTPILGRSFDREEAKEGGPRVIILSHGIWQRQYGGDPHLVGKTVDFVDGFFGQSQRFTVIGVMPAGFNFLQPADFWLPFPMDIDSVKPVGPATGRAAHAASIIGRLDPGVTRSQARVELDTISRRFETAYHDDKHASRVQVTALHECLVRKARLSLYVFQGAALLVLLVAAANIANLCLAKSASRRKEMAVRLSLGADRWRLMRQLFTESLLLATLGGGLGLLIAQWGVCSIGKLSAGFLPRVEQVTVDHTVLVFTCLVSVVSGFLFGLAPARGAARTDLTKCLKEGGTSQALTAGRPGRMRHWLVIGEIATSVVLLVGAGLLLKSFFLLNQVRVGFNPEHILVVELGGPVLQPPSRELLEGLASLPGVQAAGAATYLPPDATGRWIDEVSTEGASAKSGLFMQVVTPGYFRALGIPLLQGRGITEQDTAEAAPVAVVNETLVKRLLKGTDPVGHYLLKGGSNHDRHLIVGVVRDVPNQTLKGEKGPEAYFSYHQEPFWTKYVVLRTASDPFLLAEAIRQTVRSLEMNSPILSLRTMEERSADSVTPQRFQTSLLTLFASIALTLASVGIYGVVSCSVAQRLREFAIRVAVGAQGADILKLVMRQALGLVAIGLVIGFCGAVALTRVLKSLLFQVGVLDVTTYVAAAAFLAGIALLASYVPAHRAANTDPMEALRSE